MTDDREKETSRVSEKERERERPTDRRGKTTVYIHFIHVQFYVVSGNSQYVNTIQNYKKHNSIMTINIR